MIRVRIGSPIRQDADILREFLTSLSELDTSGLELSFYFIDDNDDAKPRAVLEAFAARQDRCVVRRSSEYGLPKPSEYKRDSSHHWRQGLIDRIITFKNDIIQSAKKDGVDFLFLVDSDIVLSPATIQHLIRRNVDIVSEVFWTSWDSGSRLLPQIWLQDENNYYRNDWDAQLDREQILQKTNDLINRLKVPGIYEVGGLGACTLISKNALERGVDFSLIDNVSFWGEDRHFCIRARVLGLGLFVDTVYPAYHIYRKELLPGVADFKRDGFNPNTFVYDALSRANQARRVVKAQSRLQSRIKSLKRIVKYAIKQYHAKRRVLQSPHSLTLSMIVHNEGDRYLREVLEHTKRYADKFVIIDDASTDNTCELVESILAGRDFKLVRNRESLFHNEVELRKLQWRETLRAGPDWILFLDADEMLEDKIVEVKRWLLENDSVDAYCFRLYDFWKEGYYRDDEYWTAHTRHMPFMLRYQPKFPYRFRNTRQHCGRLPMNALWLPYCNSDLRMKHFGWMDDEDKIAKYERYKRLDPDAKYGIAEQYESILDKAPALKEFRE